MAESKPKSGRRSSSSSKGRSSKTASKSASKTPAKAASKATTAKASTAKASGAKAGSAKGAGKPPPDIPGRIDGLRGWLDQIEHKQSRMTYFTVAGLLIALATAGVALYLGITNQQDSVKKSDLDAVSADVAKIQTAQTDTQAQLKSINETLASLQKRVAAAEAAAQQAKAASQKSSTVLPSLTPTPTAPSTGGKTQP